MLEIGVRSRLAQQAGRNIAVPQATLVVSYDAVPRAPVVESYDAVPQATLVESHKVRRQTPCFVFLAGLGVCVQCKCGVSVPLSQMEEHATATHACGTRKPLICTSGCGFFLVNGSKVDMEKHLRSDQCKKRMVIIGKLGPGVV